MRRQRMQFDEDFPELPEFGDEERWEGERKARPESQRNLMQPCLAADVTGSPVGRIGHGTGAASPAKTLPRGSVSPGIVVQDGDGAASPKRGASPGQEVNIIL